VPIFIGAWRAISIKNSRASTSGFVKVFGCRPHDGGAGARGRRPQTSKGGNRGGLRRLARQRYGDCGMTVCCRRRFKRACLGRD